jgi:general secretion pathway protein J
MTQRAAARDAGFTLVELLVAMTVLGLLAVLLFGGLRFGARAWERVSDHSAGTEDVRLLQGFLRRAIGRASPSLDTSDPTRPRIAFDGGASAITFLAPAPASLAGGGGMRIVLTKVASGDGFDLAVQVRPELDAGAAQTETVVRGLAAVEFAYFGSRASGEAPEWHAAWIGMTALPQLVRIRANFAPGDARIWPDLVIAPKVRADVTCTIDAMTHDCRGRS